MNANARLLNMLRLMKAFAALQSFLRYNTFKTLKAVLDVCKIIFVCLQLFKGTYCITLSTHNASISSKKKASTA